LNISVMIFTKHNFTALRSVFNENKACQNRIKGNSY